MSQVQYRADITQTVWMDRSRISRALNILKGLKKGHFEDLKLSSYIREDLENSKNIVKKASRSEIVSDDNEVQYYAIIDESITNRRIDDEEYNFATKILKKVDSYLAEKTSQIKKGISNFKSRTDSKLRDLVSNAVDNKVEERGKSLEDQLLDFLINQNTGHYLSQLFQILYSKNEEDFSRSKLHYLIENLEDRELARSLGGKNTGSKKRLCYPLLSREETEKFRQDKEQLFTGEVSEDLKNHFKLKSGMSGVSVNRFETEEVGEIFLIAKKPLPTGIKLNSVGIFTDRSLEDIMYHDFGYVKSDENDTFSENSQIAYLITSEQKKVYEDEQRGRAQKISQRLGYE
ncbi:MAG: hypothetical protein ABEJ83_00870 [Candidatus Nanohaloarchaea archaeon]